MSNNSSEGDGPDVRSVGPRIERPRDEQWLTRSKLQVFERWLKPMTLRKGDGPGSQERWLNVKLTNDPEQGLNRKAQRMGDGPECLERGLIECISPHDERWLTRSMFQGFE